MATARAIAADRDYVVVLAVDERVAGQATAEFARLVLARRDFERIGLLADMEDVFWRCGDYPLYLARAAFPDAEFIWQYEYDVVFNHQTPASILREIDAASDHDLLVTHLREPEHSWPYKEAMAGRYSRLWRCYFPLVRLSARAIDFLRSGRIADSERTRTIAVRDRPEWPNDEVFAATELVNNGFACSDLNDVRPCYTFETFWSDVLKHPSELPSPDGLIYHAVRTGGGYAKLLAETPWLNPRPTPSKLWSFIAHDVPDALIAVTLQDSLERYLAVEGDDPERLSADDAEIPALLRSAGYAPVAVEAVIKALAAEHMSMTLDWLRRHGEKSYGPSHPLLKNLALGMPAWQSSTSQWSRSRHPRLDAAGGNDGRRDVDFGFHTGCESAPFWTVDLMAMCRVDEVVLFNRHDYWHRLEGFRLKVSADGFSWLIVHQNDPATQPVGPVTDWPIRLRIDAFVRYVRVELPVLECLHLREVEVYGRRL